MLFHYILLHNENKIYNKINLDHFTAKNFYIKKSKSDRIQNYEQYIRICMYIIIKKIVIILNIFYYGI